MKKISTALFAVFLCMLFIGCEQNTDEAAQTAKFDLSSFATDKGIYYLDQSAYLKFFDYSSGRNVFLCTKPECTHDTEDCYASSNARFILVENDRLYTIDGESNLVSRNLDGSDSSVIMKLCSEYNNSSDSVATPMSAISTGGRFYLTYDVEVLDSDKGKEEKKTVLTCVDPGSKTEEIILEDNNAQYAIINAIDDCLYFFEYKTNSNDGSLADINNVSCVLSMMKLTDKSVSVVYQDKQIDFNPCGYLDETIYFSKDNDPVNNLYSLTFQNPEPVKQEYRSLYNDNDGNIVYDYSDNKYKIEKDGKLSELTLGKNTAIAFDYEANNGLVFSCISGNLEGKNGEINEQDDFYVSKEDFYADKNQYYKIG